MRRNKNINLTNITKYFTESYPHFAMLLVLITVVISIPFTLGVYKQQQGSKYSGQGVGIAQEIGGDIGGGDGSGGLPSGVSCAAAGCYYTATGQEYQTSIPGGSYNPYQQVQQQQYQQQPVQQQAQNQQIVVTTPAQAQLPAANTTGSFPKCTVSDNELALDPEEQQFVTLFNQFRQSKGWPTTTVSIPLNRMAAWKSYDTVTNQYLRHEPDSLGRTRYQEAADCGMTQPTQNSEILAAGFGSYGAQQALSALENQPSPDVIKDPAIVQIGIARYTGPTGAVVWSLEGQPYNDGTTAPTISGTPTPTPTLTPTVTLISGTPSVTSPVTTITQPATSITPQVTTPTGGFSFSVKIPGVGFNIRIGENDDPIFSRIPAQAQFYDPNASSSAGSISTISLTYDPQSESFKGTAAPQAAGVTGVKIRTPNSLWKDLGIFTNVSGQVTNIPEVTVVTGDLNQDNQLNLQDYNIFVSCFGTRRCLLKEIADLNLDGKVGNIDLNIFYSALANREGD